MRILVSYDDGVYSPGLAALASVAAEFGDVRDGTPIRGAHVGTDRWPVERGWISLTPLRLDLTDENRLAPARGAHPLDDAAAAALSPPGPDPEAARAVREDEARPGPAPVGAGAGDEPLSGR